MANRMTPGRDPARLLEIIMSPNRIQTIPSVFSSSKFTMLLGLFLLCAAGCSNRVDDYVRKQMRERDVPGVAVMVIRNGYRVKTGIYGFADQEWKLPVTADTAFEIGSLTKQFTAAAILLLQQDGKLSVDDEISKYLPGTPPSWTGIKIRHLLSHTSGIVNYTGQNGFELTARLTQAQFIKKLGEYPLDFQPGDAFKYSNSGYNLLGFIIENVSKSGYWDFMEQRIFAPVGMTGTGSRDPRKIVSRRAAGYERAGDGTIVNRDYDLTDIFSAGAIISTLDDMAKWNETLERGGLLSETSKKEMWRAVTLNNQTAIPYGFGWRVESLAGHENIGHGGSTAGFSASFQRFPNDDLTVILLSNLGDADMGTILARGIAKIYLTGQDN